jgi:hypothetical protein
METAEQRTERNKRTAERMRQRRAKIAEERGVVRSEARTSTLSAARFEEIFQVTHRERMTQEFRCFQSVVSKNKNEMDGIKGDMNRLPPAQHIHQNPPQQVYHRSIAPDGNQTYTIYQPPQGPPQGRIIVQQVGC